MTDFFSLLRPGLLPDYLCAVDCYAPQYLHPWSIIFCLLVSMLIVRRWWAIPIGALLVEIVHVVPDAAENGLSAVTMHPKFNSWPDAFFTSLVHRWESLGFSANTIAGHAALIAAFFGLSVLARNALSFDKSVKWRVFLGGVALFLSVSFVYFLIFKAVPEVLPRRALEFTTEMTGQAHPRCRTESAVPVAGLPTFELAAEKESAQTAITGREADWRKLPVIYTALMTIDHQLTRPMSIRVADPERYKPLNAVSLNVVISAQGDVLAAFPKAGPAEYFDQAVGIASAWKFVPFTQDGKVTAVKLVGALVNIDGSEQWLLRKVPPPLLEDRNSFLLRYRQGFYGEQMTIWIRGDGNVTFEGEDGMALQGRHCAILPANTIDALILAVRNANVFSMREQYKSRLSGRDLVVAVDDNVKSILISGADREDDTPKALWGLIDSILGHVHVQRWSKGNRFTAPSLLAENWDISSRDDANLWMTSRVAFHGDAVALSDLIRLRAPFATTPVPAGDSMKYEPEKLTAIEGAAYSNSIENLRLLFETGAKWSRSAIDGAYVLAIPTTNADLMGLIESKGAGASSRSISGKTALMSAAETGIPELVSRMLRDGADARAADDNKYTALHWAAGADYLKVVDSQRTDRRKVIEMLVKAGADIDALANPNLTPLNVNWMGLPEVAAALIAHGANVNTQGDEGDTPLMTNKSVETVEMLLRAGADPYIVNARGLNALEVAKADIFAQDIAVIIGKWMATHPKAKKK